MADDGADDRPHAGRRGWTQTTAGRLQDGRPARQNGAQSRTEDTQPQAVRIAENTTLHCQIDGRTPAARTGHSPAADSQETIVHYHVMSIRRI